MHGLAAGGLLSMGLFLAELPVISLAILAASTVWSIAVGTKQRIPDALSPEAIVSFDARESYRGILLAQSEIESLLADAPQLATNLEPVVARCRATVVLCGRLALLGNPLQRYLDLHDPMHTRFELDKLRARSEATTDAPALTALGTAASTRSRQLATHDELVAMRDRIQARLELVRAGLESFATTLVKLQVANEEQLLLCGESVAEHIEGVDDELSVLESALAEAA